MIEYSTIEHALDELRAGRLIMCTDDPDRENEGDFICAARIRHHRKRQLHGNARQRPHLHAHERRVHRQEARPARRWSPSNTDNHETAFTVSIDHVDTTTGISADERSITRA